MILNYQVIDGEIPTIPPRKPKDPEDAGWDIATPRDFIIPPGTRYKIRTNLRVWFEPTDPEWATRSWYGQLYVPSGVADDYGIMLLAGVIDRNYRGELKVILFNSGVVEWAVAAGEVICQIVPHEIVNCWQARVGILGTTVRGEDGFGSTRPRPTPLARGGEETC